MFYCTLYDDLSNYLFVIEIYMFYCTLYEEISNYLFFDRDIYDLLYTV